MAVPVAVSAMMQEIAQEAIGRLQVAGESAEVEHPVHPESLEWWKSSGSKVAVAAHELVAAAEGMYRICKAGAGAF